MSTGHVPGLRHTQRRSEPKKYFCIFPLLAAVLLASGCSKPATNVSSTYTSSTASQSEVASTASAAPSSSSVPAAATSWFAVDGKVQLETLAGYSITLELTWNADQPRVDVGSQPPGKANILISASPFQATLTNTTEGGRGIPAGEWPEAELVALYPANSILCTAKDQGRPNDEILSTDGPHTTGNVVRASGFCGIRLFPVLGLPRAGGKLDQGTLPNNSPVNYTFEDIAESGGAQAGSDSYAQPVEIGPSWSGLREGDARGFVPSIARPLAFGVVTFQRSAPISESCTYSSGDDYVALLSSNFENPIPGC